MRRLGTLAAPVGAAGLRSVQQPGAPAQGGRPSYVPSGPTSGPAAGGGGGQGGSGAPQGYPPYFHHHHHHHHHQHHHHMPHHTHVPAAPYGQHGQALHHGHQFAGAYPQMHHHHHQHHPQYFFYPHHHHQQHHHQHQHQHQHHHQHHQPVAPPPNQQQLQQNQPQQQREQQYSAVRQLGAPPGPQAVPRNVGSAAQADSMGQPPRPTSSTTSSPLPHGGQNAHHPAAMPPHHVQGRPLAGAVAYGVAPVAGAPSEPGTFAPLAPQGSASPAATAYPRPVPTGSSPTIIGQNHSIPTAAAVSSAAVDASAAASGAAAASSPAPITGATRAATTSSVGPNVNTPIAVTTNTTTTTNACSGDASSAAAAAATTEKKSTILGVLPRGWRREAPAGDGVTGAAAAAVAPEKPFVISNDPKDLVPPPEHETLRKDEPGFRPMRGGRGGGRGRGGGGRGGRGGRGGPRPAAWSDEAATEAATAGAKVGGGGVGGGNGTYTHHTGGWRGGGGGGGSGGVPRGGGGGGGRGNGSFNAANPAGGAPTRPCPSCAAPNFHYRTTCFKCNAPISGGAGGGRATTGAGGAGGGFIPRGGAPAGDSASAAPTAWTCLCQHRNAGVKACCDVCGTDRTACSA